MSIAALAATAPGWAELRQVDGRQADIDAVVTRSSGAFTRVFELVVIHLAREVKVFERLRGQTLPTSCPDRHINDDGSFCLGLRAGEGITLETAVAWWKKLHNFLLCQETATESGWWPAGAQISHGEAGEIELRAEAVSASLGLLQAYREAVEFDTGLIAAGLSKINRSNGLLRNGRSVCLCGRKDKRGNPLLRRECHSFGCPIVLEFERRAAADRFWRSMQGRPCCRTMRDCPLRREH
ncbi:MAG: hypothetical protein E6R08_02440 [Nevskiaceae bacterium]|mgnify:CR=1 FL=1|nr:MAG: hypothetical protein EKK33_06010 [Bradyrhizobiaceae bacterium]TXG99299.1 MAG: hypothetical protein E6R08_02440 [Nevskiaceae bacterium]